MTCMFSHVLQHAAHNVQIMSLATVREAYCGVDKTDDAGLWRLAVA